MKRRLRGFDTHGQLRSTEDHYLEWDADADSDLLDDRTAAALALGEQVLENYRNAPPEVQFVLRRGGKGGPLLVKLIDADDRAPR